jgi:hypothetical protein
MLNRKSAGASLSRRHSKTRSAPAVRSLLPVKLKLAERAVVGFTGCSVMLVSGASMSGGNSMVQE